MTRVDLTVPYQQKEEGNGLDVKWACLTVGLLGAEAEMIVTRHVIVLIGFAPSVSRSHV